MASFKSLFVVMLVVLIAMDTANGYFRLGRREMEKSTSKEHRSPSIDAIEGAVAAKVLRNIANCVVEVRTFHFSRV